MTCPLNREVLEALAEVDFLAALAFTDTSATFYYLTLEHVITTSRLCRFLRENQYALHHDRNHINFTKKELVWVRRALLALQKRENEGPLHQKLGAYLGPLLSRLPFRLFICPGAEDKSSMDYYWKKWFSALRFDHKRCLRNSWLTDYEALTMELRSGKNFRDCHKDWPYMLLKGNDSMLCANYVKDFSDCYYFLRDVRKIMRNRPSATLEALKCQVGSCFQNTPTLSRLHLKRCVQALMLRREPRPPEHVFKELFEEAIWIRIWTPAERGCWLAYALEYSERLNWLPAIIGKNFDNCKEALIWLFLGAHKWSGSHKKVQNRNRSKKSCCVDNGRLNSSEGWLERADWCMKIQASNLSVTERRWVLEQIIRLSPEFGVCQDLGDIVFNFFVLQELEEPELMFFVLYKEMMRSRLRHTFEESIKRAVEAFQPKRRFGFFEPNERDLDAIRGLLCTRFLSLNAGIKSSELR